jgi:outer membrane immunogenic protein
MRRVVLAVLAFGLSFPAFAADVAVLRGARDFEPPPPLIANWQGFYVGGQVGIGRGGANFGGEGSALINRLVDHTFWQNEGVPSWSTAGKVDTNSDAQYGAFFGYNAQWGDVVIGLEANYLHTDLSASALGRTPAGGNGYIQVADNSGWIWPTAVSGQSFINLTDFGTIRARAGWAVGSVLPYFTGGLALGRASYGSSATVSWAQPVWSDSTTTAPTNPWPGGGSATASDGKSNALIYGWSAGAGMDIALTPNIFVRGEYEFIQFSQMKLNLNSARIGLGLRF